METFKKLENQLKNLDLELIKHRGIFYHHSFYTKENYYVECKIIEVDYFHPQKPFGTYEFVITISNNTNTSFVFSNIYENLEVINSDISGIISDALSKYNEYLNNITQIVNNQ